jgi:galactokinase
MTGGGFAGCTIAQVQVGCVEELRRMLQKGDERSTVCKPEVRSALPLIGLAGLLEKVVLERT